jgi:hypothetical protein
MALSSRSALAAAAIVAIVVAALSTVHASDPDLGFHFATGRAVLAMHAVPGTNVLSYTQPDHPWLLHQWAPATIFEVARAHGGIAAVTLVKVVVVVGTWLVVLAASWRAAGRAPSTKIAAVAFTLAAAAASAFRFVERPLVFTNLAMAIVLFAIVAYADADARARRRLLVVAAVTTLVASHLHAGAVNAYAMLLVAAVGALVEPLRARVSLGDATAPTGARDALAFLVAALAAFAAAAATLALYNPHGIRVLTVPFAMVGDAWQAEHLIEFRPPWRFPVRALAAYWGFLACATVAVAIGVRRVHAALVALFFALAILSLRHVRVAYDFAVVAAPVATIGARAAFDRFDGTKLRAALGVVVAALAIGAPFDHWTRYAPGFGYDPRVFPRALFDVVRDAPLVGPAYVSDGWAGPFLGERSPTDRAFFDPRLEAYDPAFVRDVYQRIRYGEPGWSELLDRYGVQYVLLKYTTAGERRFQGGKDNLRQLLARDDRWSLVAFDDVGEIFVRSDGANAAVAIADAIPFVDPDRQALLRRPRDAWPGLAKALDRAPGSTLLLLMSAVASADAGQGALARALLAEATARGASDADVAAARAAVDRVEGAH